MSHGLYSFIFCCLFLRVSTLNRIVTPHEPCTVVAATPLRQRRNQNRSRLLELCQLLLNVFRNEQTGA